MTGDRARWRRPPPSGFESSGRWAGYTDTVRGPALGWHTALGTVRIVHCDDRKVATDVASAIAGSGNPDGVVTVCALYGDLGFTGPASVLLRSPPADVAAGQQDEGVVEFGSAFPVDGEALELAEQGEGLLDDVAEFAQVVTAPSSRASDFRCHDAACQALVSVCGDALDRPRRPGWRKGWLGGAREGASLTFNRDSRHTTFSRCRSHAP